MEKLKKLSEEKPLLYCFLAWAVFDVVLLGIGFFVKRVEFGSDSYIRNVFVEALALLGGIFLMKAAGQDYVAKRGMKGFGTGFVSGLFLALMGLFSFWLFGTLVLCWDELGDEAAQFQAMGMDFSGYELQPAFTIITFIIYMLLVGLAEEFTFRGVIAERLLRYYGKDAKGVRKAVVVSSVFFGLLHLGNAFSTGIVAASIQVILTFGMGLVFTMVYYKSGNIYVVALLHAMVDFGALAWRAGIYANPDGSSVASAMNYGVQNFTGMIPYLIVALILMRKSNIEKVLARMQEQA